MELWRARWNEFAQYDSELDLEEWDLCVRTLATFHGPNLVSFGGSEVKYRDAIVEGIVDYDTKCEEAWPMSPSCLTSCLEQERGYQIFFSHSRYQFAFVEQLDKELIVRNLSVFFGRRSLSFGEQFASIVLRAVSGCQVVVLILSNEYLCSKWPMIELQLAVGRYQKDISIKIIPVFYKLSLNDLSDESIEVQWRPRWEELSVNNPLVDPKQCVIAVQVLRTMKVFNLEDFRNSEVKFRHVIVEEIVQSFTTQTSVQKLIGMPSLTG